MGEAVFRIVYKKPRDGNVLSNFDIGEVSFNGEAVDDLTGVELYIHVDGAPKLKLIRMAKSTCPVLDDVHIDGWARVEIVTE